MSNLSQAIPVPTSAGNGASRDVSSYAEARTFTLTGTTTDRIVLEVSGDDTSWTTLHTFFGAGTVRKENAAPYVRARRVEGSGGGFVLTVSSAAVETSGDSAVGGKGPDSAANETLGYVDILRAKGARTIHDLAISFWDAVTGDATNNATIEVAILEEDGTLVGNAGTLTTTANATARNLVAMTLDSDFLDLADGQRLAFRQTKGGTGVQLPGYNVLARFAR